MFLAYRYVALALEVVALALRVVALLTSLIGSRIRSFDSYRHRYLE